MISRTREAPDLSNKNILFNQVSKLGISNFICLIVKQYIYAQRCKAKQLCTQELKSIIVSTQNYKKYIAIKNGKLLKHNKKWGIS